jgi:hypothetical protein
MPGNMVTASYAGEATRQVFDANNISLPKSFVLAQSGIPYLLPPAGTFDSQGNFTLGTALPEVLPAGYIYLPATVTGIAGMYRCTFSSTTQGSLIGVTATNAGAFFSPTTETQLMAVKIPGNAFGPNGRLRLSLTGICLNTANSKSISIRHGPNLLAVLSTTSATGASMKYTLQARNSTSNLLVVTDGSTGATGSYNPYGLDTTKDSLLTFSATQATTTDYMCIVAALVELIPGA